MVKKPRKPAPETVVRIRQHYARIGLYNLKKSQPVGWPIERAYRLCQMLHWTWEELAAVCNISGKKMKLYQNARHVPAEVALNLAILESAYVQAAYGTQQPSVMPFDILAGKQEQASPDPAAGYHHD